MTRIRPYTCEERMIMVLCKDDPKIIIKIMDWINLLTHFRREWVFMTTTLMWTLVSPHIKGRYTLPFFTKEISSLSKSLTPWTFQLYGFNCGLQSRTWVVQLTWYANQQFKKDTKNNLFIIPLVVDMIESLFSLSDYLCASYWMRRIGVSFIW